MWVGVVPVDGWMGDGYALPIGLCWVMKVLMDSAVAMSGTWMCESLWASLPGIIEKWMGAESNVFGKGWVRRCGSVCESRTYLSSMVDR